MVQGHAPDTEVLGQHTGKATWLDGNSGTGTQAVHSLGTRPPYVGATDVQTPRSLTSLRGFHDMN